MSLVLVLRNSTVPYGPYEGPGFEVASMRTGFRVAQPTSYLALS